MEMIAAVSVSSLLGAIWLVSNLNNGDVSMQEYDLYLNPQKPSIGLYVLEGAGLPDLADANDWIYDGSALQGELPPDLVRSIETTGHAFREMD